MVATEHKLSGTNLYVSPVRVPQFSLTVVDRQALYLALATLLVIRIAAMFALPFVDTTEARYAEIARIMLETGDWIMPQFDYGVPFWGKPPLHTWLAAAGMAVFGVGEFGARIFIFATGLAVVALTVHWVQRSNGRDQALLTGVVLLASVMFFGASAFVMTDMALLLGLTLSMVGFYRCVTRGISAWLWGQMFFLGLAVGFLAKGPVALALIAIAVVPWLFLTGHWRRLKDLPWLSGMAILAILTLPWYIAAELKTPGFLEYFLLGEHFERFVVSGWQGDLYGSGHARPFGIIWMYWLGAFFPWTLFAIPLLFSFRFDRAVMSEQDKHRHVYLLLWALSPLILFSPAANLLSAYVLPSLPASAILFASLWTGRYGPPTRRSRIAFGSAIGSVLVLFTAVSAMAVLAPQTLRLKTERELVVHAQSIWPNVGFTYWGGRSFSADFYTRSAATYTILTSDIEALSQNNVPDAVAVGVDEVQALSPYLARDFENLGAFGRRVLFIEKARSEPAS